MAGFSLFNGLSASVSDPRSRRRNTRGTGELLRYRKWKKPVDICYKCRNPCSTDSYE